MAMELVGREFTERVQEYKDIWLPARAIVQRAIKSRLQVICPIHNAYNVHCTMTVVLASFPYLSVCT